MKCNRGHEGAVMLFTSVACDVCDGRVTLGPATAREFAVRRYFAEKVDQFLSKYGRSPSKAHIPVSWHDALTYWIEAPVQYKMIRLLPGEETRLVLKGHDPTGKYVVQMDVWS